VVLYVTNNLKTIDVPDRPFDPEFPPASVEGPPEYRLLTPALCWELRRQVEALPSYRAVDRERRRIACQRLDVLERELGPALHRTDDELADASAAMRMWEAMKAWAEDVAKTACGAVEVLEGEKQWQKTKGRKRRTVKKRKKRTDTEPFTLF